MTMMLDSSSEDGSKETPKIVRRDAIVKKKLLALRNKSLLDGGVLI